MNQGPASIMVLMPSVITQSERFGASLVKALRVHAMAEGFRARLSGEQSEELREFFAEEMTRATAALG